MMRCMRTVGSTTDNWAAHAGSGSQTSGLAQGSGPESGIAAAQRAITQGSGPESGIAAAQRAINAPITHPGSVRGEALFGLRHK